MLLSAQANLEETALLASKHSDLPAHVLKELATKSETVTPWWWGLRTLIKVCMCGTRNTCLTRQWHVDANAVYAPC